MKTFALIFLLVFSTAGGNAQTTDSTKVSTVPLTKKEQSNVYFHQADNARKTGLILTIGGGTLVVVGFVAGIGEILGDALSGQDTKKSGNFGSALVAIGLLSAVASIPFFIHAGKLRTKARATLYGDGAVSLAPSVIIPNSGSVGARLIIPLGK